MLNFVLCDDNVPTLDRLSRILKSIFIKSDIDAQIVLKTSSPDEVLDFVDNYQVNVLILDINLNNKLNGCDLASAIRKKNKDIYIIFLTGHLEYALVAYKYKTFDYLPKPIVEERLEATILRLIEDMSMSTSKFIRLNNNKTIIKESTINFIKKDGMKLVFCTNDRNYEVYSSFNKIKDCLPDNFVRCHKSYMVNLNNIVDYNEKSNTVVFNNNSTCFVGSKYKEDFKEVLYDGNFSKHMECVNTWKWSFY